MSQTLKDLKNHFCFPPKNFTKNCCCQLWKRGLAIILGKIRHPATGRFAPRWLNTTWFTSCPSSSVPSNSYSATVPTWRPWPESRTWSHACWRPWKLWAIQLRQLWNSRQRCCGKSLRTLWKWMDVFFWWGEWVRYFYDILICFSTECLEKFGCPCDRSPIFFEDHAGIP